MYSLLERILWHLRELLKGRASLHRSHSAIPECCPGHDSRALLARFDINFTISRVGQPSSCFHRRRCRGGGVLGGCLYPGCWFFTDASILACKGRTDWTWSGQPLDGAIVMAGKGGCWDICIWSAVEWGCICFWHNFWTRDRDFGALLWRTVFWEYGGNWRARSRFLLYVCVRSDARLLPLQLLPNCFGKVTTCQAVHLLTQNAHKLS